MQSASAPANPEMDVVGFVLIDDSPDIMALAPFFDERRMRVGFYSSDITPHSYLGGELRGCLLMSAQTCLPVLSLLEAKQLPIPVILLADSTDIALAVKAIKLGAVDVLERPVSKDQLWASIQTALAAAKRQAPSPSPQVSDPLTNRLDMQAAWESLTLRQREFLERIVSGQSTRAIAKMLGISQRTADNHRAVIMRKMGARSISALVQIAIGLEASRKRGDNSPVNADGTEVPAKQVK